MIIWYLDLQLPMQSVPITTKVVSSNTVHDEVYLIQHYVIKFVSKYHNLYSTTPCLMRPFFRTPFNGRYRQV
jgi:ABC-type transporter Mla maintaining outer membrane lipid asymmetry ATPase subunit MlaF